jgi:hypothetical protein
MTKPKRTKPVKPVKAWAVFTDANQPAFRSIAMRKKWAIERWCGPDHDWRSYQNIGYSCRAILISVVKK